MATEQGRVTALQGNNAIVRTRRSSACEGCREKDRCTVVEGGKEMEFEASNLPGAQVGDTVDVEMKTGILLLLTFFLYVFPILLLFAGALMGSYLAPRFNSDPSHVAAFFGFAFFIAAFGLVKLKDRQAAKTGKYRPVIVRIRKKRVQTEV
jgi:sigma-E factor negative regulatory protein RseC